MEDIKLRTNSLGRILYRSLNKVFYFLPILLSNFRFRKILLLPLYARKYNEQKNYRIVDEKVVIYMVQPETTFSGGLSDRLRGIVAIYKECKRKGLPFRIVFEPLHLEDYLQPNEYDWRISGDEICWDTRKVYPCTLLTYQANQSPSYQKLLIEDFQKNKAQWILVHGKAKFIEPLLIKNYHIYKQDKGKGLTLYRKNQ